MLNITQVKNAKPKKKQYRLTDQKAMYLLVLTTGIKSFRYDYKLYGKRRTFTLGIYPEVSLKQARELHREARACVAQGVSPETLKEVIEVKTFSQYADEFIDNLNLAESTYSDMKQRVQKNLTVLDSKPVDQWTTIELLGVVKVVSDRGARESAIRLCSVLRRIFNVLMIQGIVSSNPALGLNELLPKQKNKGNFAHITDENELAALLKQIHLPNNKLPATSAALEIMPHLFLRPANIRFMKWSYIDFDNALITIPASDMKMDKELKIPMSHQVIAILKELQQHTGASEYAFSNKGKPISEGTINQSLKKLINPATGEAYGTGSITSHGFRHTASTLLNEQGYNPDAIELQLAHTSKNRIRGTYNKAQLLPERIRMMSKWSDYLDGLRAENVIQINRKKG